MGVFFSLTGRLARLPYFGYSILLIVLVVVGAGIAYALADQASGLAIAVVVVVVLVAFWGGIALAVKRLHDINMSGWHYAWMVLVPGVVSGIGNANQSSGLQLVGSLLSLGVWGFLLFAPGTPGSNRFD